MQKMSIISWQEHKQQGNASYTAGKTAEAVDFYTKALQSADLPSADRATILCNRAQCYLKLNDNAKAAEDCTACLTLSPDNVKALFRRFVSEQLEQPNLAQPHRARFKAAKLTAVDVMLLDGCVCWDTRCTLI